MTTLPNRPRTALIVIDVQNGVVTGTPNRDGVVANINTLVSQARAEHVPVIWVQHNDDGMPRGRKFTSDDLQLLLLALLAEQPRHGYELIESVSSCLGFLQRLGIAERAAAVGGAHGPAVASQMIQGQRALPVIPGVGNRGRVGKRLTRAGVIALDRGAP